MNRIEHLLTIAAEECNETAHRISKALRFGLLEVQTGQSLSNGERIVHEFADLVAVLKMLEKEKLIDLSAVNSLLPAKEHKVECYLLLSEQEGTLSREP